MKHLFIKQIATLAGGTAFAQIINLGSLPLLTRLYAPDDFGMLAVFAAISGIISVCCTLKYENAILVADTDEKAAGLTLLVMILSIIIGLVLFLLSLPLFFLFNIVFIDYLKLAFAISLGTMLSAAYQALYFWNNRFQYYTTMTRGRVIASIILASSGIIYGYIFGGYEGLIIATIAGLVVNTAYLMIKGERVLNYFSFRYKAELLSLAKEYKRFPFFLIPSSLLDRISSQIHILTFAGVFGPAVSGSLGIHNKVVGLPTTIIGRAVGDVFKRRACEQLQNSGQCKNLFIKTSASLSMIAIPPTITLMFFAPEIFVFVLGGSWQQAGEFSQILSIHFLFSFIVSPVSSLIYLESNQKYDLYVQFFLLVLLSLGLGYAVYVSNLEMALFAYVAAYVLKYIVEFLICYKIALGNNSKNLGYS